MYSYAAYRVPFADTDLMGIVHHSNYARFFERGRIEFLRQIGILYADLVRDGVHFPVLKIESTFKRPLNFDDTILIESKISELTKARLAFSYRILRVEEAAGISKLLKAPLDSSYTISTTGLSDHCCLGYDLKPRRIPDKLFTILHKYYSESESL